MQAVILTGIVAGFVHVVSGADHLIAMAPAAINNPQKALKNSFSWGLGHSSGVILLAFLAIFIKDITPLNKFSSIAEFLVGISLLIVGVFAIKNSLKLQFYYLYCYLNLNLQIILKNFLSSYLFTEKKNIY